jgi:hypothetical protein
MRLTFKTVASGFAWRLVLRGEATSQSGADPWGQAVAAMSKRSEVPEGPPSSCLSCSSWTDLRRLVSPAAGRYHPGRGGFVDSAACFAAGGRA